MALVVLHCTNVGSDMKSIEPYSQSNSQSKAWPPLHTKTISPTAEYTLQLMPTHSVDEEFIYADPQQEGAANILLGKVLLPLLIIT